MKNRFKQDNHESEYQTLDNLTKQIRETSDDAALMNLYYQRGHLSQDLSISGIVKDHALYEAGSRDLATAEAMEMDLT